MTVLDRAFIKAYRRPTGGSATAVAEPPRVVALAASQIAVETPVARATVPISQATVPLSQALAGMASTSAADEVTSVAAVQLPSLAAAPVASVLAEMFDEATRQDRDVEPENNNGPVSSLHMPTHPAPLPLTGEGSSTSPHAADAFQQSSETASFVATELEAKRPAWQPMLQVDRVTWPNIHSRLQNTAAAAVDVMIDALAGMQAAGCKRLGMASCDEGEGVTTLLLAAARKLVGKGLRVAVVDANWTNPQIAGSLGLLPQIGWEETLGGGLPLEEVVIESLADGLAVLPVREPSAGAISHPQIAASLDILGENFDLVLVDLGTLSAGGDEDDAANVAEHVDAIVLVQNVRITTPNRLTEVRRKMAASNLPFAGILQNFVAG